MEINKKNVGVVILAAGKGTRLGCTDKPKVMLSIGKRPIVSYIVETLLKMGFNEKELCLVVGFHKEQLIEYFGNNLVYAVQEPQLGTAHAAYLGMKSLPQEIDTVLVLQGDDSAFYKPETLLEAIEKHVAKESTLTLLTVHVEDPAQLGRIVRHPDGRVEIIEKEYVTDEQKKINEVSTGTFIYNRAWFQGMYPSMPPLRKLGEYCQPTALAMAREAGLPYQVLEIEDPTEWRGINTPNELKIADELKNNLIYAK